MQKNVQGLYSLTEIFENKIFRIPDYQRGYSWKEEHVKALWDDLLHLSDNKIHYTGMISVQKPNRKSIESWRNEELTITENVETKNKEIIFDGKTYLPFYVTDGQQRLTTLILLLTAIRDNLEYQNQEELEKTYILETSGENNLYKFNYEKIVYDENDTKAKELEGYDFLADNIFQPKKTDGLGKTTTKFETSYTENLKKAKKFFDNELHGLVQSEINALYEKITNQLHFNFYEIPDYLDIFTIFETMNYRGKPLTTLELLKNRLIYLISISKEDDDEKELARKKVNGSWAVVYAGLAKNPKIILNDDDFLRLHWLMYFDHKDKNSEKLQKYKQNLLNEIFIKENFIDKYDLNFIKKYVKSLAETVSYYFCLKQPYFPNEKINLDTDIKKWVWKINKLSPKSHFEPLILAILVKNETIKKTCEVLEGIEKYLFWTLAIAGIRSNFNKVPFLINTSLYFSGKISVDDIIKKLKVCEPKKEKNGKRSPTEEAEKITIFGDEKDFVESFRRKQENNMINEGGFLNWKYLKYFLFEYELSLSQEEKPQLLDIPNVELIFPPDINIPLRDADKIEKARQYKEERTQNWQSCIKGYGVDRTQKYLCYTLGNIVLTKTKREEASSFETKKELYKRGTQSQRELCAESDWTPTEILKRGVNLLVFLEERWGIKIEQPSKDVKKQILGLTSLRLNSNLDENKTETNDEEKSNDNLFDENKEN